MFRIFNQSQLSIKSKKFISVFLIIASFFSCNLLSLILDPCFSSGLSFNNPYKYQMTYLIWTPYQLVLILICLPGLLQQNLASKTFISDQVILYKGNNAVQYQQTTTSYTFSSTFQDPPSNIDKIFAVFNGFNFINQNRISFSVTVIHSLATNSSYSISFIPLNSLIFYSVAFTVIGTVSPSSSLLYLDQYYLTPSTINSTPRSAGNDQETFTLGSLITLADANFQVRSFISFFDSNHSSGNTGVTTTPTGTFAVGTTQFNITVTVEAGLELYLCSVVAIVIDKNGLLVHHAKFAINGIQVYQGFSGSPNITLSSKTSSNFSIPSMYGPIMSRNCTIGFYEVRLSASTSQKSIIFDYTSSSGTMNVVSAVAGGGVMASYQALCIVDCSSDGFYSAALQKCDFCQNYIENCQACNSATLCTDCGAGSFFNNITIRCGCQVGLRVLGGCTTISGCISVDDLGLCLQCKAGLTLSSNARLCQCPTGYILAGFTCTNVLGCITAAIVNNQSRCLACNISQNYQIDGNGRCGCLHGYSLVNGICTTLCGNGQLFGLEQCDDGNHVEGDGCSSYCQVQASYVCNTTGSSTESVCSYKTEFAEINFVESYRDYSENSGYFIFTVQPAISNLNKMDFASSITVNCPVNISKPVVEYSNGVLQIKIIFLEDLENRLMNITLKFNQTIVIHKPITSVFDVKSLNSPMTIFTKFPEYRFVNLYLKVLSIIATFVFLVASITHKMMGVETIHLFQFIFFSSIYEVAYSDIFLGSVRSLRFAASYPDVFYNEMVGLRQGDIFQSLMFAFTFVGNYYIIGTVTFLILFIFVVIYFRKLYKQYYLIRTLQQPQVNPQRQKLDSNYAIRKETLYSTAFFPIVVGFYLQCFFAAEAQLYRKQEDKSKLTMMTNSFLSILFIWLASFTIFRQIFSNLKNSVRSVFYNVQNKYISLYLINILFNIIFFNFSDQFQYDLTSMASYNFAYLLVIVLYRPYKNHLHNFHIFYNQTVYILWIILLIYQDRADVKLSEHNKYIALTSLLSALSLSLLICIIRIILEWVENGLQMKKIKKYFKHRQEMANSMKKRSERKMKHVLKRDVEVMNNFWAQEQQKCQVQINHEIINAQRNAIGMPNLFPSPKYRKQQAKAIEMMRKQTTLNEQVEQQYEQLQESKQTENQRRKQAELDDLKMKLRENLLKYKQKKKKLNEKERIK